MRRPLLAVLAVVLAVTAAAPTPAAGQCAMCRTALTGSPEGQAMGRQFNAAILVMLFSPYVVVATVAGVLFRRQLGARLARLSPGRWGARRRDRGPGPWRR